MGTHKVATCTIDEDPLSTCVQPSHRVQVPCARGNGTPQMRSSTLDFPVVVELLKSVCEGVPESHQTHACMHIPVQKQ